MLWVISGLGCGGLLGFRVNRRCGDLKYFMQMIAVTLGAIGWYIILFNVLVALGAKGSLVVAEAWFESVVVFLSTVPTSSVLGIVQGGYIANKIDRIRRFENECNG